MALCGPNKYICRGAWHGKTNHNTIPTNVANKLRRVCTASGAPPQKAPFDQGMVVGQDHEQLYPSPPCTPPPPNFGRLFKIGGVPQEIRDFGVLSDSSTKCNVRVHVFSPQGFNFYALHCSHVFTPHCALHRIAFHCSKIRHSAQKSALQCRTSKISQCSALQCHDTV